ncbi:11378_t:CDS:2 [Paraglomus occultum]|uniref:11378_t:CDS:1 n=1 Tax=Paraglomus occultum TaxID=144539 RepID=A0A9N8W5K8_9GLOM|nr:11378_t:CDS:2 [Paraglomus occultum]
MAALLVNLLRPTEICRGIRDMLRVKTDINIDNRHPSLSLGNSRAWARGQTNVAEYVEPQSTRTITVRTIISSRGIIVYEIQNVTLVPHYLIITWTVKNWLKRGTNSVSCHVQQTLDNSKTLKQLYKDFHDKANRRYVGTTAIPMHEFAYRISAGITDGSNAQVSITIQ